jgi:CysZ protein
MRSGSATRPAREFIDGLGLLGRGFALYGRSPRLVILGVLPALIAFVILAAAFGALVYFIGDVARAVTWFAGGWPAGARDLVRLLAGVAVLGVAALLFVIGFTAFTLAIGDPFYEKISGDVDARCGGLPNAPDLPWWRGLLRGLGESARLVAFSAAAGILLFLAGLLPAVGQTVVPVVGAFVGGWALALELTGVAFARRGLRLRDRRRVLRRHRPLALGFGVGAFLCFLVPLGAVLLMPAAVAGATLLTRRVSGEPSTPAPRRALPRTAHPAVGR